MNVDVTKLSTKGQIVIPESIRQQLKLQPGDCFIVRCVNGSIRLEKIK